MGIKFRQRIFLLLALFCTSLPYAAFEEEESLVTEITITDDKKNLGPSVQWLEDPSGKLTFEQVRNLASKKFNRADVYTFNQGYTSSSYWLKFQIEFPTELLDSHWLLEIPFPLLDYVALYAPDANNNYSVIYTGDRSSFSQRDIDTTDFVFNIRPKQPLNTYYIHVRTQDSLQVPLFLWAENAYPKHNALATGLQGAYFGIMIVMILYNLFIFLSVRDLSYLYYIGYISCFTIFQSSMEGYSFEYLWPNNTWWANINIPFLGVLSLFFAALFARNMLNTKDLLPRLDKVIQLLTGSLFIILPIILFGSYKIGIYTALITSFVFFNLILFTALLAAYKGDRTAKIFAIAWSIFLIGGGIGLLGMLDILPLEYASQTGIQIGSALEVILLSLALADRINLIEKEKTEIEAHSKTMLLEANKQLENSNQLEIAKNLNKVKNTVRNLSHQLSSVSFEEVSFKNQIINLVSDYFSVTFKIKVEGIDAVDWSSIKNPIKRALFLSARECIQNSIKHANATKMNISFSVQKNKVQLCITDNGVGFEPKDCKNNKGLGTKNIESRVEILNGLLTINSEINNGIQVSIII